MTTHPEIAASFRPDTHGVFLSTNGDGFISCPPYTIASVAASLDPELIEWPEGYDWETLEHIQAITGWADRDVAISARQASELADLGKQILDLHAAGKADLGYFAEQSIRHLVQTVSDA
jgi:hypothetical protein